MITAEPVIGAALGALHEHRRDSLTVGRVIEGVSKGWDDAATVPDLVAAATVDGLVSQAVAEGHSATGALEVLWNDVAALGLELQRMVLTGLWRMNVVLHLVLALDDLGPLIVAGLDQLRALLDLLVVGALPHVGVTGVELARAVVVLDAVCGHLTSLRKPHPQGVGA